MISFVDDPKLQWKLALNDMRSSKIEYKEFVACASSKEELEALLVQEKVPTYRDADRWGKTFRKDGPLEWFNTSYDENKGIFCYGPREAVKAVFKQFGLYVDHLPPQAFEKIDDIYRIFYGH